MFEFLPELAIATVPQAKGVLRPSFSSLKAPPSAQTKGARRQLSLGATTRGRDGRTDALPAAPIAARDVADLGNVVSLDAEDAPADVRQVAQRCMRRALRPVLRRVGREGDEVGARLLESSRGRELDHERREGERHGRVDLDRSIATIRVDGLESLSLDGVERCGLGR